MLIVMARTVVLIAQYIYKSGGGSVDCHGFHSCSNVSPLVVTSDNIVGYGGSALVNSNVTLTNGGQIQCAGDRTCADSFIVGSGIHGMWGHLSGQNSIFKSYDSGVYYYFGGKMSGNNGTILCGNGHTCYVTCYGDSCNGLNLTCIEGVGTCTLDIDCTYAEYDEYVCPDGDKLSLFMNGKYLPDLSNVSSSYSDYQKGLNDCKKTGMQQTDFCFGYESCGGQLKNDSVCCSGAKGCENVLSIETQGSRNSSSNIVRCDGWRGCRSISNGINITKASGGTVYISGYRNLFPSPTTVNAGWDGDIVCTGRLSCWGDTLTNANNLYCNGHYSCDSTMVSDITNVYGYGYWGATSMTIVKNVVNVYCVNRGCYEADINNVDNDLYCYGWRSLYFGSVTNVKNVFVFGYEASYGANMTNVTQLYCDGTEACSSMTISNVSNIEANGTNVLDDATISSGGYGGTIIVTLYGGVTGSVSITCETSDTCVFNCSNTNTCDTMNVLCNGNCLFSTDSPTNIPTKAPTITMPSNTLNGNKAEVFCDSDWTNCTIECNSFSKHLICSCFD